MTKIITSSDEGVQLNEGTRFGFVGSGYELPNFALAVKALAKTLGETPALVSSQEDDWLAEKLDSRNPNLYRDTVEKLAKEVSVNYIGQLDFGDPRVLDDGETKGHLVRPPKIHVADTICFTCGGGEQTFNLRNIVLSADFASEMKSKDLAILMETQVQFCERLIGHELEFVFELEGELGEKRAKKNQAALLKALPELIK
jgi:hypothetical protein